jgi:hypothetical protein
MENEFFEVPEFWATSLCIIKIGRGGSLQALMNLGYADK